MGKLAERYGDPARSGLYRVRDGAIPCAAAAEADALLLEFGAAALADGAWRELEQAIARQPTGTCVVLVRDAEHLPPPLQGGVVASLRALAEARCSSGRAFFAVMVDPEARLDLPPLYKERPGKV